MTIQILIDELTIDPDGRGYVSMNEHEAAADMNIIRVNQNKSSMTASEVYNLIDNTEWGALTSDQQRNVWDILQMGGNLNPFGREATDFVTIFGGGSTTITNLQDARIFQISRGQEIGWGKVKPGHIQQARGV